MIGKGFHKPELKATVTAKHADASKSWNGSVTDTSYRLKAMVSHTREKADMWLKEKKHSCTS